MAIAPDLLRSRLEYALRNEILSARESGRILNEVRQAGGLDEAGAAAVVDALAEALRGEGLDLTTNTRLRNLNALLGELNQLCPLPLGDGSTPGSVTLVELLRKKAAGTLDPDPTEPTPTTELSTPSFGEAALAVTDDGVIQRGGQPVAASLTVPTADDIDALWGLNKPAALANLSAEAKSALAQNLAQAAAEALAVPSEEAPKYRRHVAVGAALGAMSQIPESWDAGTVAAMLKIAAEAPTPFMQAVAHHGLGRATLTDAQRARFEALQIPEGSGALMASYQDIRRERLRAGYYTAKGPVAGFAMSALVFAKDDQALESVVKSMGVWTKLDGSGWSASTVAHMNHSLETYVDSYPQVVYLFGSFEVDAPKEVAKITSARAVAQARPQLEADPPSLNGFPLTRAQADYVLSILHTVRDEAAVMQMVRCLDEINSAWEASSPGWGDPSSDAPLNPAAFDIFQRAAVSYQDAVEAQPDGKLGYDDLRELMRREANDLRKVLRPRLSELSGTPPQFEGVRLDAATAAFLQTVLTTQLRSLMSVENLGRAVKVVSEHYNGSLDGAGGAKLRDIINDYAANWPRTQFLDFNKLERIGSYQVRGRPVPLAKINGRTIPLGEFFQKVATEVEAAFDRGQLRYAWMADRWGFRAKASVELLDVIAELYARREGPLAVLRERYPNADIRVDVSGRAGANEEFVFVVTENGRSTRYTQGSDGTVGRYNQDSSPVLFTAAIGEAGDLDVSIPNSINARTYPLQTNYAVGDSIDIYYNDTRAEERAEAGKPFSTQSKILEATIKSYTYDGKYTVEFIAREGAASQEQVLTLSQIRKANHPHFFSHDAYREDFSDVSLDFTNDAELRTFLEGADPIINRHLPVNDPNVSLSSMSANELARRQLACIKELMDYASQHMSYPTDREANPDEDSQEYHDIIDSLGWFDRVPLGKLLKIKRGVCRHQCIAQHLLLQRAGIDSRLSSGAANTSSGNFRGYHIWVEVQLADGSRYLSDQTWNDPAVALWDGAYDRDKRRIEMYYRTARYDANIVT